MAERPDIGNMQPTVTSASSAVAPSSIRAPAGGAAAARAMVAATSVVRRKGKGVLRRAGTVPVARPLDRWRSASDSRSRPVRDAPGRTGSGADSAPVRARWSGSRSWFSWEAEPLQAALQRVAGDPQDLGGPAAVAVGLAERLLDEQPLRLGQLVADGAPRGGVPLRPGRAWGTPHLRGQVPGGDGPPRSQDGQPLDQVAQLPHVARPGVGEQDRLGL